MEYLHKLKIRLYFFCSLIIVNLTTKTEKDVNGALNVGSFGHGRFSQLKVYSRMFWANYTSDILGPINSDRSIIGKEEIVNHDMQWVIA